jgi:RNA polymerase sigma-70 factor, ECF subfamily
MKFSDSEITQLLVEWSEGNKDAFEKLTELIYDELHRMAHHYLKDKDGHTLQTTALINEVYIKLVNYEGSEWRQRAQFFALASKAMRQILVDHARSAIREKRGSGQQKVALDEVTLLTAERSWELVALDDALKSLETIDPRKSRIVELRYFGGFSIEETSQLLNISTATVSREMQMATAWLRREISRQVSN